MPYFNKDYWDHNYSEPSTMDGIGNSGKHIKYIKSFFDLEMVDISSIIDLGAGYGHLFQKSLKTFMPYKASALEPSDYAFKKLVAKKFPIVDSTDLSLKNESIEKWCVRKDSPKSRFDLGICTSVFQYLEEDCLDVILPVLSRRIKYLYLTVPTDVELDRQVEELGFNDTYALRRTRKFYREKLASHFTNISSKIWESKFYYNENTTLFTDLVYRS
jgi:hypothetical protein